MSLTFRRDLSPAAAAAMVHTVNREALQAAAPGAEQYAKSLARVDTGAMRDATAAAEEETSTGAELVIGCTVDYGIWNEIGTAKVPAQPFVRPAADAVAAALPQIARAAAQKAGL